MGPSAGAGLVVQNTDVLGPVADQRERLFGDAGKYEFPLLAVRDGLTRLGIDGLHDEVVFIDVHAVLFAALKRNAGTGNFSEAIYVIGLDPETAFNVMTHLLRPGFRAEDAGFELDLVAQSAFIDRLRQIGRVGRRAA